MSPINSPNGVECETDERENYTSIVDESDWITNASSSIVQIDDLEDGGFVLGAVETEPTDDEFAAKNGATLNANSNEIESDTISTRSTSDEHSSNDG